MLVPDLLPNDSFTFVRSCNVIKGGRGREKLKKEMRMKKRKLHLFRSTGGIFPARL